MSLLRLMKRDVDNLMTEKIQRMHGTEIAGNDTAGLLIQFAELNGFKFLEFQVIAPLKVKTFKGCVVTIKGAKGSLEIESDTMEIDTDYSKSLGLGITEFDIDLEDELIDMIKNDILQSITIKVDGKMLVLTVKNQAELQAKITSGSDTPPQQLPNE